MFPFSSRIKALRILRETFLAFLPVVLIMNSLVVLSELTGLFNGWGFPVPNIEIDDISRLYYFLIPLFVNLALSNLLAQEKSLDQIGTMLIAMVCFLRGTSFLNISQSDQITSHHGSILSSIPITWLTVWLLHYLSNQPRLKLVSDKASYRDDLSPRLITTLNFIVPGLLTVLCIELLRQTAITVGSINPFAQAVLQFGPMQPIPELVLYKAISLCAWIVGLHGDYSASGIFRFLYDTPVGDSVAIQLKTFHAVFMNMGGAGATLPVPFIILFSKRLSRFRAIAKLSLPFALFNINETLLFGLPILLNPIFLVPFLSTAFVNMAIAFTAIRLGLFSINPEPIQWMLPSFCKAYAASNGSIWAILTQLLCIIIDGCIYYPFLIAASRQCEASKALSDLLSKGNSGFITEAINQRQEAAFVANQGATIKEDANSQKVLRQLKEGTFLLYFQPKFNAKTLEIVGLEALLRFQDSQGKVIPPTFLSTLYHQGLSKIIDQKVVDLMFEQLKKWQRIGIKIPTISLNFDKDFLLDTEATQAFIHRAKEHDIQFCIEITEHTYVAEIKALASVVRQLRAAGHHISIDDFGTGYSSLTSLVSLEADEVKLDRALAVPSPSDLKRGIILLSTSVQLCHDLGFLVVAEGIETKAQLHLAQRCAVDIIQGYYLARPLPAHRISRSSIFSRIG